MRTAGLISSCSEFRIMEERFVLQKSNDTPGWWVLTDTANEVVIRFKEGDFNGSQKVTVLGDTEFSDRRELSREVLRLTRAVREMADWLAEEPWSASFFTLDQ